MIGGPPRTDPRNSPLSVRHDMDSSEAVAGGLLHLLLLAARALVLAQQPLNVDLHVQLEACLPQFP